MDYIKLDNTSVSGSFWAFKGQTDYVDTWTFMENPYMVIIILLSYLVFVTKLGPQYMKNKPPYNLDKVLFTYNAAQVLLSLFLMYHSVSLAYRNGMLHKECIFSNNKEEKYYLVTAGYYGMLAKASELLDTIFFVLRKKQNQVTFLHVYHHIVMLGAMWVVLKYDHNENFIFAAILNTSVHVIMYTYYGLSTFPALKKYLWWKRYITRIQLVQFLSIIVHLMASHLISDCPPSTAIYYFALFNMLFFYYLFNNFYKDSYIKPKKVDNLNDQIKVNSHHIKCETGEKDTSAALRNNENTKKKP